jgi:hypothetical protein
MYAFEVTDKELICTLQKDEHNAMLQATSMLKQQQVYIQFTVSRKTAEFVKYYITHVNNVLFLLIQLE